MKLITKILLFAAASFVVGSAEDCATTDHLFYDASCCDGKNCLDSIQQTSKDSVDNLIGLKRSDGSACQDDDLLKYAADAGGGKAGVICAGAAAPPQNNTRL